MPHVHPFPPPQRRARACHRRLAPARRRWLAVGGFALAWLLVVLWNLRTGLSHGYTLQQELPIHALLFAVPVAFAAWLAFRARRR